MFRILTTFENNIRYPFFLWNQLIIKALKLHLPFIFIFLIIGNNVFSCSQYKRNFDKTLELVVRRQATLVQLFESSNNGKIQNREAKCWKKLLDLAFQEKKIDKIDQDFIRRYFSQEDPTRMIHAFLKKVKTKTHFQKIHEKNSFVIPSDLKKKLTKNYSIKFNGLGRIDFDTYMYTSYSIEQINYMANLMYDFMKMTNKSYFTLTASDEKYEDRKNYEKKIILSEIILVLDTAYNEDRVLTSDERSGIKDKINRLKTFVSVKKQGIDPQEIEEVFNDLGDEQSLEKLDEVYEKLANIENENSAVESEVFAIDLGSQDAKRFINNHLVHISKRLPEIKKNLFSYPPAVSDLLLALVVSGKIKRHETISTLMKNELFKPKKRKFWQIAEGILIPLGSTLAAINPTTSFIFLGTTIAINTARNVKAQKDALSKETFLIPANY